MTRRRNLLLWFAFASIPLAPLVIVPALALKPAPSEASRLGKRVQEGMTIDQVRAAIGWESKLWAADDVSWRFPDGSELVVSFDQSWRVVETDVRNWKQHQPWYARIP